MKGIVFSVLEQVVVAEHGERTWDGLLEAAGVDGAYTAVGSYPDEELSRLVRAAAAALRVDGDEVLRWFGRSAMPLFADRYPHVFEGHTSARALVLTLNDVIHPEVRKLFPGAYVPEFDFTSSEADRLVLGYRSERRLCAFAEGLLHGAADHFREMVTVEHAQCMKRGDDRCVLNCIFGPN